jgi:hypothetical protein
MQIPSLPPTKAIDHLLSDADVEKHFDIGLKFLLGAAFRMMDQTRRGQTNEDQS